MVEIVSPEGIEAVAQEPSARRLGTLEGKTLCEIWNGVFKGDISFPAIRGRLLERFPTLKIVPYTEFPHAPASDNPVRQRELAREIASLARAKGGDALISGNGA